MKRGTAISNTLGVVAVMYSGLGFILQKVRDEEDGLNTIGSATMTGLLFKSTNGLKKCAIGGLIGLTLSSCYVAFTTRDKMKNDYPSLSY